VMNGKQKTFAVALSRQMAPTAHIVAYCIVEGEVVTDAMSFYVRDTRLLQVGPFNCYFVCKLRRVELLMKPHLRAAGCHKGSHSVTYRTQHK